jgi:CrcB protein
MSWMTALFVAVAGAVGVLARYGLGVAVQSVWTTVAINIAGSFLLGLLVTMGDGWSSDARLVLGVGFLGGFTTFSTLTVQVVIEIDAGHAGTAAAYLLASVVAGLAAAVLGYVLGRALV